MPPRAPPRRRGTSSPDPLEGPLEDCIIASPILEPVSGPSSTRKRQSSNFSPYASTPRKSARAAASPATTSPIKSGKRKSAPDASEASSSKRKALTPRNATPVVSRKGKEKAVEPDDFAIPAPKSATPKRSAPASRTPKSAQSSTTPLRSTRNTPTLGSSLKPLPTPPSGRKPTNGLPVMRHFDEAFKDPFEVDEAESSGSGAAITREVFLANESLKRQREARNFRYEGDADAPKLTRSGRVIGKKVQEEEEEEEVEEEAEEEVEMKENEAEAEEGLEIEGTADEGMDIDLPAVVVPPETLEIYVSASAKEVISPLLPDARQHILRILSSLTGQHIARNPPPFADEDTNEALQGLVNLLKGTVERGEGNSALLVGPRGTGKTRTIARAIQLLPSTSTTTPIIVRLSSHAQTNDRLAIREMGRQIAEAEGKAGGIDMGEEDEEGEEGGNEEYAPTTLPSHLLALLTQPSPRAIIVVMEEFDLFTEHARQALLYCLLDVVQSVKTGPVESTGRGVAVVGLTSRIDTLLLLEKRVKSRFSHRVWRVASPISPGGPGWKALLRSILIPASPPKANGNHVKGDNDQELQTWLDDWQFAIDFTLDHPSVVKSLDRLTGLTTDIRNVFRPFIVPIAEIASSQTNLISVKTLIISITSQIELAGWGLLNTKLKGLAQPELAIIVISKHLAYAGREEFNFAQVEEEYLRFARTRLVGSGRIRWPIGVLRVAFDNLLHLGLLVSTGNSTLKAQFAKVRCTLSPHEIVAFFKGEGANLLSTELSNWGRMMGGHA